MNVNLEGISFTYRIDNIEAFNKYDNIDDVITSVVLTVIATDSEGKRSELTKRIRLVEENVTTIDPETFMTLDELRAQDDPEKIVVQWCVDYLKEVRVPDPFAEFEDETTDQLSVFHYSAARRIINQSTRRRNSRGISLTETEEI